MNTVCFMGGDSQFSLFTHYHTRNSLVPSFDDLADAEDKLKGSTTIERRVEFGAIEECAGLFSDTKNRNKDEVITLLQ